MKKLFLASILLLIFGVVGKMDFDDAVAEEAHYCSMVASGAWPAYKGECNGSSVLDNSLSSNSAANSSALRPVIRIANLKMRKILKRFPKATPLKSIAKLRSSLKHCRRDHC